MNFLKYCGIGATSGSQQQDRTSEPSSGTPAPSLEATNDTNNNGSPASPAKSSAEDEQADLPEETESINAEPDTIHPPTQDPRDKAHEQGDITRQTEPIETIAPDMSHTPSQDTRQAPEIMDNIENDEVLAATFLNLPDNPSTVTQVPTGPDLPDGQSTVPRVPTDYPLPDRDSIVTQVPTDLPQPDRESTVPRVPTDHSLPDDSQLRNKPVGPKPTETQSSKRKTDERKRKVPPTIQSSNRKQLKTNTNNNALSVPIQINSDDESEGDRRSDVDSLLDKLAEYTNELGDNPESPGDEPDSSDNESENSDNESENSDNEGQKTDDERHLPRPRKRRTDKELEVTRSKKIIHPADELEEGLGEDEAGNLKDSEVPAHIHVGETDQIATKGPKPDHQMLEKQSAKVRADDEQDKPKKEVPIKAYQLMIHYTFQTIGLNSADYPVIYNMAVKYLSSTNFFNAKVFSAWGAQKRINTEADLLREASARYPHYVLTMAPDLILCLIAAIDLRPEVFGEPNGRGITIIGEFHVFQHLRSAIELGETISWGKGSRGQLLMLGRRGEEESVPPHLSVPKSTKSQTKKRKKLPEAVPDPYPANVINIQQEATSFMEPYPFRPTLPSVPITKTITAEEWDRQNAHWLDQLMAPDSTKEIFGPTIKEQVTEEIFPLISKARRHVLNRWAKSEDFDLDPKLLEAPILPQVELLDEISQEILTVETDTARRSIRAIETAALGLPKAHQKTAALIKQHTDRLFACRDHEIDNNTMMIQSVAKLRQSSSVTATTLQVAFEDNEARLRSRVDPAQTAREKGLEAFGADLQEALKSPTVEGSADQLILFLKTHWRMRQDEISDWQDMANSVCQTATEAGHPMNRTNPEGCDNHDWDSLLRLANTRGGKALVTLLNMERCAPDEDFLNRRNEWYKDALTDEEYESWSDMFPIDAEPQSGGQQP